MSERRFGQGAGLGAATGPPVIDISLSVGPLKFPLDPFFYLYAPDAMGSHSASMSCLRCSLPDKTRLVCARCLGESHSLYELPEMQFQRRDTGRDIYDRGSCRSAQSRPLSEPPLAHLHPSIVAQLLWWGFSRLRIINFS